MQINYIILAHDNPPQLYRLVERLASDGVCFYIHIDLKADICAFQFIKQENKQVVLVSQRVNCIWGDISMVKATLNCMEQLVADGKTGYTVLMSGQDYPLKNNRYIANFFQNNYGKNYISLFSLPSDNWVQERGGLNRLEYYKLNLSNRKFDTRIIPPLLNFNTFNRYTMHCRKQELAQINGLLETLMKPRIMPGYISRFYGGGQWWAFPIETIYTIRDFLEKHPDYLEFHTFTFAPDEIFFHTIIGNSPALLRRTENSVTYVDWISQGAFRPATFDMSYYSELAAKKELFARKFNSETTDLLDRIDAGLGKVNSYYAKNISG